MIEKWISSHWAVRPTFSEDSVKTAGFSPETYVPEEIRKFAESITPDRRCCYAHVIAMSDGNHYGTNMNGDWFDESELLGQQSAGEAVKNAGKNKNVRIPRYKTFEEAKFFRHHDNQSHSPFYGDVALAVWNDVMKRVELVIRIFREVMSEIPGSCAAPEVAMRIDHGGYITVSMGCRIHHEQCMHCKNENEFVSDRCHCLRHRMNEILPDGRIIGAKNFGMRFFDISDVTIPADPIAFSLGKVASYQELMTQLPPLLRNHAIDIPKEVLEKIAWRRKWAEMEKIVPGMSAPTIGDTPCDECPQAPESPVEFEPTELQQLVQDCDGNVNEAVSTLTSLGIVLAPNELAQLSLYAAPDNSSFDDPNFAAPTAISLDKFSHATYHSLKSKLAMRSGFLATCPANGWEPSKLAEMGGAATEMADYYSYYRELLRSLPRDAFVKAAYANHNVRELLGENIDHSRVKAAMYYLAYAGLPTA